MDIASFMLTDGNGPWVIKMIPPKRWTRSYAALCSNSKFTRDRSPSGLSAPEPTTVDLLGLAGIAGAVDGKGESS